jgi:hypothetical protein
VAGFHTSSANECIDKNLLFFVWHMLSAMSIGLFSYRIS